jgi:hypothetical protein
LAVDETGYPVARAKGQTPKPKRAGINLLKPLLIPFREETRGKGLAWLKTVGVRLEQIGTSAFFGEAGVLWHGHETAMSLGKSSLRRNKPKKSIDL